jgi:hypothetical protein
MASSTFEHVADTPPTWLTVQLGVLRRPQTAEEGAFSAQITDATSRFFPFDGDRLYAQATRLVTFEDGTQLAITVAQAVSNGTAYVLPYDTCTRIRRRVLARLLSDEPAAVRRRARALEADEARHSRPGPTPPHTIGVASVNGESIRAGGPTTESWFEDEGAWSASPIGRRTAVVGIVPDGVANVRLHFDKQSQRIAVRDNLFTDVIKRPIDRAFPDRLIWETADGAAIKSIIPDVAYADFARP